MSKRKGRKVSTKKASKDPKAPEESEESEEIEEEEYQEERKNTTQSYYMSIFEYATLVSARAVQLKKTGERPQVDLDPNDPSNWDCANIAARELREGKLSLIVRRTLPNGEIQDIPANEMIFPRV